jgi:hypothetical protein
MWSGWFQPMFRRNRTPPSCGFKSNPRKEPAEPEPATSVAGQNKAQFSVFLSWNSSWKDKFRFEPWRLISLANHFVLSLYARVYLTFFQLFIYLLLNILVEGPQMDLPFFSGIAISEISRSRGTNTEDREGGMLVAAMMQVPYKFSIKWFLILSLSFPLISRKETSLSLNESPNARILDFPQSFQANARAVSCISLRQLPSIFYSIHFSLIILTFDVI